MQLAAVLAPGYGGSAEQPILRALAARLTAAGIQPKAVTFTRQRPGGDFAPEIDDLRHAREVLRGRGAQRIALVGRSFGGRMCTRLAALESPDALVLLGYPISPPHRPRPEDEAALTAVRCSTLIVQGDRDRLGPLNVLHRIATANPVIDIYVLAGTGHQFGPRLSEGLEYATRWLSDHLGRSG